MKKRPAAACAYAPRSPTPADAPRSPTSATSARSEFTLGSTPGSARVRRRLSELQLTSDEMQACESGRPDEETAEVLAELDALSQLPFDEDVLPGSGIEEESLDPGVELESADPGIEHGADNQSEESLWRRFLQRYRRWVSQKCEAEAEGEEDKNRIRRQYDLKCMTLEKKLSVLKTFMEEREIEDSTTAFVLRRFECLIDKRKTKFVDARQMLLTFNGEWGLVKDVEVPAADTMSENALTSAVNQVCEQLRTHPGLLKLWEEFSELVHGWKDTLYLASVAFSFELCTHTLAKERMIRVHAHAFLRNGGKIRINRGSFLSFHGVEPHRSDQGSGGTVKARGSSGNAGLYYLQTPKIGSIFRSGSLEPFKDYLVSGEWIMNLVQAGKMEYHVARDELVRSAKNLPRLLQSLDRWHAEVQRCKLRGRMERVQREVDATRKPFKCIPIIDDWVKSHSEFAMRFKFLVLCGGSGLGKTQFAKNLVPAGKCLELNMACAPEPDMREYDFNLHDLVLFDECCPSQVLRQKKTLPMSCCGSGSCSEHDQLPCLQGLGVSEAVRRGDQRLALGDCKADL